MHACRLLPCMPIHAWQAMLLCTEVLGTPACCRGGLTPAPFHIMACKPTAGLHVQGEGGHFYVTATAKPASKEISLEALEKRKMEINKYLVQGIGNRPHRLSLSQSPSIAGDSQLDDSSVAPTPQNESPSPTPRTLSLSNPHNQEIPAISEGSNPDLSHQRSPRSGKLRGGLALSDRPLLGGDADDLARSKSFTGQELRQWPSNLSVATGRDMDEESLQAMRRFAPPLHALPSWWTVHCT